MSGKLHWILSQESYPGYYVGKVTLHIKSRELPLSRKLPQDMMSRKLSWILCQESYPGYDVKKVILDMMSRKLSWILNRKSYLGYDVKKVTLDLMERLNLGLIRVGPQTVGYIVSCQFIQCFFYGMFYLSEGLILGCDT